MYIQRVVLENIKGFRELDFTFGDGSQPETCAGWTVLTGDNGSGKTALLKAIALAVIGPEIGRALQPSFRGWIRKDAHQGSIAVQIAPNSKDSFTTGRRKEGSFWSELELLKNGGPEVSLRPGSHRRGKQKGPINGPWAENTTGWFVVGYGPFRRLYGASPEATRLMTGPGRVARFATMFKEDATLAECERWLKDLNYKRLEKKDEGNVLDQVLDLLNDDFLRQGISVERVDSDGLWIRDASGTILPLEELSDGYRAALALMIDILRHLKAVYGDASLVETMDGRRVVLHPGVVLIDEVDAHLHPAWQRRIGEWLTSRFPQIQFIVTTHSPLVAQSATGQGIFTLPGPGEDAQPRQLSAQEAAKIRASRADTILLSDAFGLEQTRGPWATRAREGFARLNAKRRSGAKLTAEEQGQLKLWSEVVSLGEQDATADE